MSCTTGAQGSFTESVWNPIEPDTVIDINIGSDIDPGDDIWSTCARIHAGAGSLPMVRRLADGSNAGRPRSGRPSHRTDGEERLTSAFSRPNHRHCVPHSSGGWFSSMSVTGRRRSAVRTWSRG